MGSAREEVESGGTDKSRSEYRGRGWNAFGTGSSRRNHPLPIARTEGTRPSRTPWNLTRVQGDGPAIHRHWPKRASRHRRSLELIPFHYNDYSEGWLSVLVTGDPL